MNIFIFLFFKMTKTPFQHLHYRKRIISILFEIESMRILLQVAKITNIYV